MSINHFYRSAGAVFTAFILFAAAGCGGSSKPGWKEKEEAEDREIGAYFASQRPVLAAKKDRIDSILHSLQDVDEKKGIGNISAAGLERQISGILSGSTRFRSALAPIALDNMFLIYLEKNDESGDYETDFREVFAGKLRETSYRYNDINIMLQSTDSVFTNPIATYKLMVADFLKRKYLVVTDCICLVPAELISQQEYSSGYIVKKIRIYDLTTGKIADEYYLATGSSESMYLRIRKGDAMPSTSHMKVDLRRNYLKLFHYSIFLKESLEEKP